MKFVKDNTLQRPILTGIALMLSALIFRLIDIFVLRLDELLGEIILFKAMGFCLVWLLVWAIGRKSDSIGFHNGRLGESILMGIVITVLPLIQKQMSQAGCCLRRIRIAPDCSDTGSIG